MEGQFHFLALSHIVNSKEAYGIILASWTSSFQVGSGWIWKRLE
jgi:hypothetical protein